MTKKQRSSLPGGIPSQNQPQDHFVPTEDRQQSRFGLASFIMAFVTLLAYIIMASLGTSMIEPYMIPGNEGLKPSEEDLQSMTGLAVAFILVVALNLFGLLLGLAGCFKKNTKRSYAVLGSIINGVVLITILTLFIFVLNS